MLDIFLISYFTPANKHDPQHKKNPTLLDEILTTLVVVTIAVATLLAIGNAYKHRYVTSSYSADIVVATFSPLMYWVLYVLGGLSHPIKSS
jgi:hypothetical protein